MQNLAIFIKHVFLKMSLFYVLRQILQLIYVCDIAMQLCLSVYLQLGKSYRSSEDDVAFLCCYTPIYTMPHLQRDISPHYKQTNITLSLSYPSISLTLEFSIAIPPLFFLWILGLNCKDEAAI